MEVIEYGADASQFGELSRPAGRSRGVVVVIHGGFWKAAYGLELGRPLAAALAAHGWTAWNVEYRRVGNGGGAQATCTDVHGAIDHLATLGDLDRTTVLTLGHSAGGHLAVWAAGRHRYAGDPDSRAADRDALGSGAVHRFLGHPASADDEPFDPRQQLPLDVPVRCLHGTRDDDVPTSQSREYVAAATELGADARVELIDADHYDVIDPAHPSWQLQLATLDELRTASAPRD